MRALIDTCVIVDALQNRKPFDRDAQTIMLLCANLQFEGFLTAKSITDIYYLTHRITHDDKQTREILSKLCTLFKLLDTTGLDIRKAISSDVSDFEDAVMTESAVRSEMNCIVTRNIKDYRKSGIPILSPSEFIDLLEKSNIKE